MPIRYKRYKVVGFNSTAIEYGCTEIRYRQLITSIARRLYHCYDLSELFDFLTWFEFTPKDASVFEDLVGSLRAVQKCGAMWSERSISVSFAKPRVSNQCI
jgi:hypothetical protein